MVAQTQNLTIMENQISSPLEAAILIDRCLEIEKEYDSIEPVKLLPHSVEDVDDLYQAKLEQQWYKKELEDEYRMLNDQLGYKNRVLSNKSSRRTGM